MLVKKISILNGVAIAIAMVVGSGLFALPGLAIKATDPVTALVGWGLIILLMPSLIHIFSFLGQRQPSSEGLSLYASIGFGSWSRKGTILVTCGTLAVGMPAFFLVGGSYIAKLLEIDPDIWATPCAILLAIVTTAVNLAGLEKLGSINKLVVILVLVTVIALSLHALPMVIRQLDKPNIGDIRNIQVSGIWLAASIVFWAFQGWENLTFGFAEIENPERNIPLIYWLSFLFVAAIYGVFAFVISAAAMQGLNVTGIAGVTGILPAGPFGKFALVVMVLILLANANSWVFGCSRAFYSAAGAGLLPKYLAVTNRQGLPANSLIGALIVYILIMLTMWVLHISEQFSFLMTTQGFILLYGGAILAFFKTASGILNRTIGIAAIIGWGFLMHGFGWMILYPITLLLIGAVLEYRQPERNTA